MEVLRSNFTAKTHSGSGALEGINGPNGFFFKQRRGHLDLRVISSIDLEKLVREVDIDSLQIHIENLTFCNMREEDLRYLTDPQVIKLFKISQLIIEYLLYSQDQFVAKLGDLSKKYLSKKKSLAKKRREVQELAEETKHLRNQVKAKKQNISTLEDLLRENSRREALQPKITMSQRADEPVSIVNKATKIKFFVAGPDGLSVEFVEWPLSPVSALRAKAKQAFVSRKDSDGAGEKTVRLVFRGNLLLDDRTLDDYHIGAGDTVVAVPETVVRTVAAPPAQEATANVKDGGNLVEVIEFLSKQQEAMREFAHDIKHGWESALQTVIAGRNDGQQSALSEQRLLEKLDDRWERLESGVKTQLDAQLHHYEALLEQQKAEKEIPIPSVTVTRRRLSAGDLQSDTDDAASTVAPLLGDISNKLSHLGTQLSQLEDKSVRTDRSIVDLRDALQRLPQPTTGGSAPPPEKLRAEFKKVRAEVSPSVPHKTNKWNSLGLTVNEPERAAASEGPVVVAETAGRVVEAVEVAPAVAPAKREKPPSPRMKAKPDSKGKPAVVEPIVRTPPISVPAALAAPALSQFVAVTFPRRLSPDLARHSREDVEVLLERSLPTDEIVFELRKAIAGRLRVSLSRVTLSLNGKDIVLDMDLNAGDVQSVASLAASGALSVKVHGGKPLTNAQIDLIVPSWQRAQEDSPDEDGREGVGADEGDASSVRSVKSAAIETKPRFRKRREWGDGDGEGDEEEKEYRSVVRSYDVVRGSMDEALSAVSDVERLTDDEMRDKMTTMRRLTESLPPTVVEHLKIYRGTVVSAVAAATIDSGSEDFISAGPRSYQHPLSPMNGETFDGRAERPQLLGRQLSSAASSSMSLNRFWEEKHSGGGGQWRDSTDLVGSRVLRRSVNAYDEDEGDDLLTAGIYSDTGGGRVYEEDDSPMLGTLRAGIGRDAPKHFDSGDAETDALSSTGQFLGLRGRRAAAAHSVDLSVPSSSVARSKASSRYSSEHASTRDSYDHGPRSADSSDNDDRPFASSTNGGRDGSGVLGDLSLSRTADSEVLDFEEQHDQELFLAGAPTDRTAAGVRDSSRVPPSTPPSHNRDRDSPGTKAQRTFSNVSKASDASLFRDLPNTSGRGAEPGRDRSDSAGEYAFGDEDNSVHSLALSDSNHFEEEDSFR